MKYENAAIVGSAVTDSWDRRPAWLGGNTGKNSAVDDPNDPNKNPAASAMGTAAVVGTTATVAALGPYGASTLLYSLWRDPSIAAYALQTWGVVDALVFPAGTGRP